MNLQEKVTILQEIIREHAPLLIAYSGGVDSALLAAITLETLGPDKMQCILVDGPELPRHGLQEARTTAEILGLPFEVVPGKPLADDLRRENPHDRCRHCKLGTFQVLAAATSKYSCSFIADGANASDLGEHRPGISAFSSCGVIHPFIMASITKGEIREIARMRELPFWDKPSSACLYSRIPYGDEITLLKLRMVEMAEDLLLGLGFRQVRVRHHGQIARIEILPGEFSKFLPNAEQIDKEFRRIGFSYVTLDLRGYRSGSMDEVLKQEDLI
jgi:pyridinium-3,5-biscarboxylic acid mononucleotide sulfurtransferase